MKYSYNNLLDCFSNKFLIQYSPLSYYKDISIMKWPHKTGGCDCMFIGFKSTYIYGNLNQSN